ncbi:family 32 glycosyltransferase [Melampsora larici-populina 98AG31]|uniref:Family 32 glycosyltransferase n=1 Tax=Melampsora larici-populina (strain 98AG31 / pathotype 3-4-7) TaxID=747676 RepID=F4RVP3_MELLP|nr:family 32 glycosyltransferase [Melampsora larici-populina 98AG31]EGG03546.1 family 32 glycosyltransferase [Melampsora larici-populina 98AG31]
MVYSSHSLLPHHHQQQQQQQQPLLSSTSNLNSSPTPSSTTATLIFSRRRHRSWLNYALLLLLLIVLGTIIVLSTANALFGIHTVDLITSQDLESSLIPPTSPNSLPTTTTTTTTHTIQNTLIPKIIHQTWKTERIPDRWLPVRATCAALHPDWEYVLWTDQSGRELIIQHYPWFLKTFDGYRYPIQRADAVRYFVLHQYGGVYMDLDIGCVRPMDSLISNPLFDLLLPQTIPVGVSNDLMFSSARHPFMEYVINHLQYFDHDYFLNYPTVMFSTGPMALSALYSQFRSSPTNQLTSKPIRILPPELYGKNLPATNTPSSAFFAHYYGSCWHTDDAGFIVWLGKFGMLWLYGAIGVLGFWLIRFGLRSFRSFMEDGRLNGTHRSRNHSHRRRRLFIRSSSSRSGSSSPRFADVLLLPVTWLEEKRRKSVFQSNEPRCKCCGGWTSSSESGLPAYESHTPTTEEWQVEEEDLFLSPSSVSSPLPSPTLHPYQSHHHQCRSSPIQKAFYKLAELTGVSTSAGNGATGGNGAGAGGTGNGNGGSLAGVEVLELGDHGNLNSVKSD